MNSVFLSAEHHQPQASSPACSTFLEHVGFGSARCLPSRGHAGPEHRPQWVGLVVFTTACTGEPSPGSLRREGIRTRGGLRLRQGGAGLGGPGEEASGELIQGWLGQELWDMQGTWSSILPFSFFRLGAPAWLPATPGDGARGGKELDMEDGGRRKEAEKKSLLGSQPAVIVTAKFHFNLQIDHHVTRNTKL